MTNIILGGLVGYLILSWLVGYIAGIATLMFLLYKNSADDVLILYRGVVRRVEKNPQTPADDQV